MLQIASRIPSRSAAFINVFKASALWADAFYKRPCKIWAPYGGHCVEKSLAPKSKYVDTPKPGSINCLNRTILMV